MNRPFQTTLWICLLLGLAWGGAAQAADPVDLLFVVDGSKNLGRGPEGRRIRGVVATLSSLQSHRIARLGVVTFGGRIETTPDRSIVFPLGDVPRDAQGQRRFFADLEEALAGKLTFSFSAADFNVPFTMGGGIMEVLRKREEEKRAGRLLVLFVSDGDFQVVELMKDEEGVLRTAAFEEYTAGAQERYGDVTRETVNRAALDAFQRDVADILAGIPNLVLVPARAGARCTDFLGKLAVGWKEDPVSFGPGAFPRTLLGITRLLGGPDLPAEVEKTTLGPGEEQVRDVMVSEGVDQLVLAAACQSPAVTAELVGEGSVGQGEAVITGTDGGFPCFRLAYPAPGLYRLRLKNTGTEEAAVSLLLQRHYRYGLSVEIQGTARTYFSGEEIPLTLRMTFGTPPASVTDPEILREATISLELIQNGTTLKETRVGFENLPVGERSFGLRLGEGELDGAMDLRVTLKVFPREDGWKVLTPPVVLPLSVSRSFPVIEVDFSKPDSFIGERVRVMGTLKTGRMPQQPLRASVRSDDGTAVETTLFAGTEGTLAGELNFPGKGTWRVTAVENPDGISILPGEKGLIEIRERTVNLFVPDGGGLKPLDRVPAEVKLGAAAKNRDRGTAVLLRADLRKEEKGVLTMVAYRPANAVGSWKCKFQVGGKEAQSIELDGSLPTRELTIVVIPDSGYAASEKTTFEGGTIVIQGRLGETPVSREVPIDFTVIPGPPPWYLNPIVWVAGGAVLALVLVAVLLLTAPRFDTQNVVLEDEKPFGNPPFFFIDHARGFGKNKALGTDELGDAVKFTVKGRGSKAVCYLKPLSGAEVKVNGRKISGKFALNDGNLLEISKDGGPALTYRYYQNASPPEDLEDDEFVIMEYDEDEEFVLDEGEVLVEFPPEFQAAAEEVLGEGALEQPEPPSETLEDLPLQETGFGVDILSSPTALPEKVAAAEGEEADDDATMSEPAPDIMETHVDDVLRGEEPAEDVPAVDADAFGDFFDEEETIQRLEHPPAEEPPAEEAPGEGVHDPHNRPGFDDGETLMSFDSKTKAVDIRSQIDQVLGGKPLVDEEEPPADEEDELEVEEDES
jgi:hypothetical protein